MGIMSDPLLTCPMCGHRFDASEHTACHSCPLNKGCVMICCPKCGYNTIDTRRSVFARLAAGLFSLGRDGKGTPAQPDLRAGEQAVTLAEVPQGWQAKVVGFSGALPAARRAHLEAYGLIPSYPVRVLQHSPVTVIQVDHTELALERALADEIQVKIIGKEI
jgi:Fe2+ transport system protein FeoA